MGIVILIENYPAEKAYQFCLKALENQNIHCIFFYGQGALNASFDRWNQLAKLHKINIYACVKSVDAFNIPTKTIKIAGLSTFVAHALAADQVIQFKADAPHEENFNFD